MAVWDFQLPRGRGLRVGARPLVVGVLNCTPDSFSDGGMLAQPEAAIRAGSKMLDEGADWIDVGGESTRPGSLPVPSEVQLDRILPVIRGLRERTDAPISVDTTSPAVAREALAAGADIFNDVSACRDPPWRELLRESSAPIVLMHMQGTPLDMQEDPRYPEGVVPEVVRFFQERLETLRRWGVSLERTILDPGIGFGKRVQHNLELLRNIEAFARLGRPVFIGASRKGFVGKVLGDEGFSGLGPERDLGTVTVNAVAIHNGAHILRVHDVRSTRALVRMFLAAGAGPRWTDAAREDSP
ncbi:MAG: dihydropteroate synthase [Planctomycetes bacterium]|nr:dihydropteroate synthase [Planctomycetota bacterium]